MLKVTIKFLLCLLFCCGLNFGCSDAGKDDIEKDAALHIADSLSEARIDSAYKAITDSCDTLRVHKIPVFVDSLMKGDSAFMNKFFNSEAAFVDSNKKVEKIVRQLQDDCDAALRRETFKKLELRLRPKRRKEHR